MSDIPVNVAVYTPRPMRFPPYVEPPARRARRMIYPIQAFYWPPTHRAAPMSLESPAILRAHFLPILAVISVTTRPFVFVQT